MITTTTYKIALPDGDSVTVTADKLFVCDGSLVALNANRPVLILAMRNGGRADRIPYDPEQQQPRLLTNAVFD